MEKVGMKREGIRKAHFKKGELYFDIHDWGVLREEF
jgi:RimJ/RimL family protein N-acetyltransferase